MMSETLCSLPVQEKLSAFLQKLAGDPCITVRREGKPRNRLIYEQK
jgi:hypothetical protein